ncbi:MAG: hypothetical protein DHS20C16_18280 [Phycisphaerae bacterium]|nr:MAG: hypothetical protein DHS20C16_18280 [Phycisphaerae bacterium]
MPEVPTRLFEEVTMHYPRRNSKIKKSRKQGFRARMKTVGGRRIINAKRRRGTHKINVAA